MKYPYLKLINGIMSNVTLPMLLKHIETVYPNMEVSQISRQGKDVYSFSLVNEINDNGGDTGGL